MFSIFKNTRV